MDLTSLFERARAAGRKLLQLPVGRVDEILRAVADEALAQSEYILSENARDLERMSPDNPMYDRLKLTSARLEGIAADTRHVADLPSPLGRVLKHTVLPNGLDLKRVSVPFGVIGVIYEARPNVSFDVFSLCFKAGSACVLKGGSDADFSNRAIVKVIHGVLERFGVTPDVVVLLPAEREATAALLQARGYVDLLIPRGSSALIQYVRESARIPVIETGAGVCHAYFDVDGDVRKGAAIVNNAKTRRVSVCNALDSVLIHASRLSDLPQLCAPLQESRVRIYADSRALTALQGHYPADLLEAATEKHFGTEFMDYKMAVKTVDSLDEALAHIARFGSGHSECIITENADATEKFLQLVDAACVCQCADLFYRRGSVRTWSRDRHQHPETACPRPDGVGRNHDIQMVRAGRRTGTPEVVRLSIIKQQSYESISKRRRLRRFESRLARGFRGKE